MKEILELINEVKTIKENYKPNNTYGERFINHEEVLYYTLTLFDKNEERDLAFYIEYYKISKQLLPIICITKDFILYETLNLDSVKKAIYKLKKQI